MSSLIENALAYAQRDWAVFPLHNINAAGNCSCGKLECSSAGKHPRTPQGLKNATVDSAVINNWWSTWPEANIAICTGAVSGIAVLDIDGAEGEASLTELEARHGKLPETLIAITGKGRHFLFEHPGEDVKSKSGVAWNGSKIDARGDGGYIVAAPSNHVSGRQYAWQNPDISPVPMPAWLIEVINAKNIKPISSKAGTRKQEPAYKGHDPIPDGERNSTLASLAGSMRRRGMSAEAILDALLAENQQRCNPPLEDDEVCAIANSISNYDAANDADWIKQSLNDVGNAERLIKAHGADVRFIPGQKRWLKWDRERWHYDTSGHVMEISKNVVRAIFIEAASCPDSEMILSISRHAKQSMQQPRLKAMVSLAETDPAIVVEPAVIDANPWLLGVDNGIVDLRTGKLGAADREHMILRYSPVSYDLGAECLNFLGFLDTIFDGDQDLISFMQRIMGYCLTGDTSEQCIFFLYGKGGNGKSTLTGILGELLGDYARQASSDMLMQKLNGRSQSNDLARLNGARAVIASEIEDGSFLAETLVKEMTGGDTITARFLYGEFFEFKPQFKMLVCGNHKPIIKGEDEGIWRRMRLIPFTVTIPPEKRDKHLMQKLRAELPGILQWTIQGCLSWQKHGLNPPQIVTAAVDAYRTEMDLIGVWLDDRCDLGADHTGKASDLYGSYGWWAEANGFRKLSSTSFGRKLGERFTKGRGSDGVVYHGVMVRVHAQNRDYVG